MTARGTSSSSKLREFSTQLAARIQDAPRRAREPVRLLVRIGAGGYLFALETTGEIVPLASIASVPWTRPWFRGLAAVRGRLVSVIDLVALSGGAPLADDEARQLLVLGESLQTAAALLVTRASGLRNLERLEKLEPAESPEPWVIGRYRDGDGSVLTEIDPARLVASESFSAIGS